MNSRINVTQPFMPPLEEFIPYLKKIWEKKWLTNNGDFHRELETRLCEHLGVKYISLFANGTMALVTALQALRITGEVITTPYSFVATTHALWWNGIKPVFVDIERDYLNINAEKIEAAITPRTTAILAVHVYGNPCDLGRLQCIADTYGLRLIYDACHAFGVRVNGESILNFGDLSILSFHATKVFTTFEGGAIVCGDEKTKQRIDHLKNFGFANETTVIAPGINAKMNEVQSAFGLLQLRYIDDAIAKRREVSAHYNELLEDVEGIEVLKRNPEADHSYPYYPVIIDEDRFGKSRDTLYEQMKSRNIYCRRYFYPLISQFSTYKELPSAGKDNLPVATEIAKRILCLPMYPALSRQDVDSVVRVIRKR